MKHTTPLATLVSIPGLYEKVEGKREDHAVFTLPFTSRDEYVAWRAAWKEEYRELSDIIRWNKQSSPRRFAVNGPVVARQGKDWVPASAEQTQEFEQQSQRASQYAAGEQPWYFSKWDYKAVARMLLAIRKASKVRANECWMAEQAQRVA